MRLAPLRIAQTCLLLLPAVLAAGCGGDSLLTQQPPDYYSDPGREQPRALEPASGEGLVYIIDRTGKRWEVSHARRYGLNPDEYQFGLGPYAIAPLNDPVFLNRDHAGFPDPSDMMVLGLSLNNVIRAYPTWTKLVAFEVINDEVGGGHVPAAF